MAQTFPTSAQVIYDTLAADATFMSTLGSYDFRGGGGTMPALSIVSAGEDMPALRNVQGVECIIQDAGDIERREYLTDEVADLTVTWKLFLVAWEPAKGADMQAAAEAVCRRFAGSFSMQTVSTSDGLGALVQTMVQIYSNKPILSV